MRSSQLRFEALLDRLSHCAIADHVLQEPHGGTASSSQSTGSERAIFDHFIGSIDNGSDIGLVPFSGISGSTKNIEGENGAPGIVRLSTGKEPGGYAGIASPASILIRHQAWKFGLRYRVLQAANADFCCGFLETGAYFQIDRGRLYCCFGDIATDTGIGVPGSIGWNLAEIEVSPTGETTFTHNGVVVGQLPDAMPLSACPIGARLKKITGTASLQSDLDWISLTWGIPDSSTSLPTPGAGSPPVFDPFVFEQRARTSLVTTDHPFSSVQRQNASLIDVTILDWDDVPQRLGYRWGWRNDNPNQGTITFTSSPPSAFVATLTLKFGANFNY